MDRLEVLHAIGALGLHCADYVVVGGAAMTIRGIRDTGDIDLVVTPELFDHLARVGWHKKLRPNGKPGLRLGDIEAYLDVNTRAFERSTTWLLQHAEVIEGVPCVDLDTLTGWKRSYGREKDRRDVALLESFRAARVPASEPADNILERNREQ
jgi:hypothetical protein